MQCTPLCTRHCFAHGTKNPAKSKVAAKLVRTESTELRSTFVVHLAHSATCTQTDPLPCIHGKMAAGIGPAYRCADCSLAYSWLLHAIPEPPAKQPTRRKRGISAVTFPPRPFCRLYAAATITSIINTLHEVHDVIVTVL